MSDLSKSSFRLELFVTASVASVPSSTSNSSAMTLSLLEVDEDDICLRMAPPVRFALLSSLGPTSSDAPAPEVDDPDPAVTVETADGDDETGGADESASEVPGVRLPDVPGRSTAESGVDPTGAVFFRRLFS